MKLKDIHKTYFIGIGGIGMSAIARYFLANNIEVSGYDRTATALTRQLENEGVDIHYKPDVSSIPKDVELVVFTPAIPREHPELQYYLEHEYVVQKRSETLQWISAGKFVIAISGSHGKTTVSAITAHILKHSENNCTAFLGGIAVNYNSNFIDGNDQTMIIEADEYDRSFHRINPDIAVVTAVDTDHLDIYGSKKQVEKAFREFAGKIKKDGILLVHSRCSDIFNRGKTEKITYALPGSDADIHAQDITIKKELGYQFKVAIHEKTLGEFLLPMGGRHNVENALAAIVIARLLGIDKEKIKNALVKFKGIKRRFEFIINTPLITYIDDYAHHPRELDALLTSVREMFPDKKISVIFQPHLYSRTRDLASEFAQSLSAADRVALMPIYPAREQPIEGVNSQLIYDRLQINDKFLISKKRTLQWVSEQKFDVLLTAGAGDIDQFVIPIKEILQKRLYQQQS